MNHAHRALRPVLRRISLCSTLVLVSVVPLQSQSLYTEAPMLAARVASGVLPPVDDRLPSPCARRTWSPRSPRRRVQDEL